MLDVNINENLSGFSLAVSLQIPLSGVTAIYGPSGAGKSTLLQVIAGLIESKNSYIKKVEKIWQNGKYNLPMHKRKLAYVSQKSHLFPHLNASKNILYGYKRIRGKIKPNYDEIVSGLFLESLLEKYPHQLSGGQSQRVSIAQALLSAPELLLMDEPLAALDEKQKKIVVTFLIDYFKTKKIPVIFVSHSKSEIIMLADRVIDILNGNANSYIDIKEFISTHSQNVTVLTESCTTNSNDEIVIMLEDGKLIKLSNQVLQKKGI